MTEMRRSAQPKANRSSSWGWAESGEPLPRSVVARGSWYDQHSRLARIGALVCDTAALTFGAAVPLGAADGASTVILAVLGAGAALATGIGQLFGWRRDWVRFAPTLQSIETEVALFRAHRGPYEGTRDSRGVLVERVESLVTRETGAWRLEGAPPVDRPDAAANANQVVADADVEQPEVGLDGPESAVGVEPPPALQPTSTAA